MRRRLFSIASMLSLLFSVATVALWVRSYWTGDVISGYQRRRFSPFTDDYVLTPIRSGVGPISFHLSVRGSRYTLRLDRGRAVLDRPPSGGAARDAKAAELAGRVKNSDACWVIYPRYVLRVHVGPGMDDTRLPDEVGVTAKLRAASPTAEVAGMKRDPAACRALLAALEDPRRATAAHVALHFVRFPIGQTWAYPDYDGVTIPLTSEQKQSMQRLELVAGPMDWAEQQSVIEKWHSILDVASPPVPLWPVAVLTLLPAMGSVAMAAGRRRRRMRNQCPTCGYDLRASSGRCPECGTINASAKAAA